LVYPQVYDMIVARKSLAVVLSGGKKLKELMRYNAGVYCRLSKQDRKDTKNGSDRREESVSVQTQRDLLGKYVNDRRDRGWKIHDYYVDDDHTGTNYKRPGFERMLEDIENGAINMVVVKDLSRLGRSHIETDTFMEIFFPSRGVRVIAVDENIDSINMDENNNDIVIPMKNMLNELYSRDLSRKVRSAVRSKKQSGLFLSNYAPIGYMKDPKDKHRLIIEESGAVIVRRIFEMARSDMGSKRICNALNDERVLTPINHRKQLMYDIEPKEAIWQCSTVDSILRNRTYLGDTIQGVFDCPRFKRTPTKIKPKDEWIITPKTHEPIVSAETFELVQKLIDARNRPIKNGIVQLFAGFVKCEDCGYALGYAYNQNIEQYTCGQYRRHGKKSCSCHYIRKDVLEQAVLDDIRKYSKLAKNDADKLTLQLQNQNRDRDTTDIMRLISELETLNARSAELKRVLKCLYEDSTNGKLGDELFDELLHDFRKEQSVVQSNIDCAEQQIKEIKADKYNIDSWIKLIRKYTGIKRLDRSVLSELIDKITVGETKEINGKKVADVTIYYRFVGAVS